MSRHHLSAPPKAPRLPFCQRLRRPPRGADERGRSPVLAGRPISLVLADRDAGPGREHARGNVHALQLLEQQLGRVWYVNLRDLGLVLARPAFKRLLREVATN